MRAIRTYSDKSKYPEDLANLLEMLDGKFTYDVDSPCVETGCYFIDVDIEHDLYVFAYIPKVGFGFWSNPDKSEYGVKPDVIISNVCHACSYLLRSLYEDTEGKHSGVLVDYLKGTNTGFIINNENTPIKTYLPVSSETSYFGFPNDGPRSGDHVKFVQVSCNDSYIPVVVFDYRPSLWNSIKHFFNSIKNKRKNASW